MRRADVVDVPLDLIVHLIIYWMMLSYYEFLKEETQTSDFWAD